LRRDRQAAEDGKAAFSSPTSQSSSGERDLRHVPAPGIEGAAKGPAKAAVVGNAPEGRHDELDSILLSPGEVPRARIIHPAGHRAGGVGDVRAGSGGDADPVADAKQGGLADDELDSILSSPGDVPKRRKNDRRKSGIPAAGVSLGGKGTGRLSESKLASDSEEEKKEEKNDENDESSARFSAGDAVLHRRSTVRRTNAATVPGGDRPGEDARWAAARKKVGRRRSGIPGGLAGGGRGLVTPRGLVDDDEESLSSVTSDLSASVASVAVWTAAASFSPLRPGGPLAGGSGRTRPPSSGCPALVRASRPDPARVTTLCAS
ncbi:hypothetical protein THAOC_27385, partial [Thalassiosira oceanica]